MYIRHYLSTVVLIQHPHTCPGACVEIEDKRGNTALHTAARHGHASVSKTLVSNGANVLKRDAGGMLPVHMACLSSYSICVENLIPRGRSHD